MAHTRADTLEHEPEDDALTAGLEAAFGPAGGDALRPAPAVLGELGVETRVELPEPGGGPVLQEPPETAGARYEPRSEIGRGAMGVIIRTRDTDLGRDIAMKVLHPRHADNRAMVQRFIEEARIAGQLQHPGVLQVYELGLRADRRPYFTMKLIKGKTLAALLKDRPDPATERRRFLSIFEDICQTMAYSHARRVIHRDLKPANVMVGNFGEVQIVDWGLAKLLDGQPPPAADGETVIEVPRADDSGSASIAGSVMGTPSYMPPEQARGDVDRLDARSDVFALGAILCEILTGRPPYGGPDALDDARAGRLDDARGRLDRCGADPELIELARHCLQPDPAARPADAGEVAATVTSYLASLEERARASELAAAEARARAAQERRARRLILALAMTVIVAVAVSAGSFIAFQGQRMEQMAANSQRANAALAEAQELLEQARETTPVGNAKPWMAVRAAGINVAALRAGARLDEETQSRVDSFLDEFTTVERDARMVERIEELVIAGATHEDRESWIEMEAGLRDAFREYGIDLEAASREEIARRISESELSAQLADGLELWIATAGHLAAMGAGTMSAEELMAWMDVLYAADPDPFRTAVRKQIATGIPDPAALEALREDPAFETALPRTLSWLGTAFAMIGDVEAMDQVYLRAITQHPGDFMLNFDYALQLKMLGRWEEAEKYFLVARTVRPATGGIWRSLGLVQRELGKLDQAVMSLRESIRYQPDYAPTHVDLGRLLQETGDVDGALEVLRAAIAIQPDLAPAHCFLGLALQEKGRLVEAIRSLDHGHDLGSRDPDWPYPSDQWIKNCLRLIEQQLEG